MVALGQDSEPSVDLRLCESGLCQRGLGWGVGCGPGLGWGGLPDRLESRDHYVQVNVGTCVIRSFWVSTHVPLGRHESVRERGGMSTCRAWVSAGEGWLLDRLWGGAREPCLPSLRVQTTEGSVLPG